METPAYDHLLAVIASERGHAAAATFDERVRSLHPPVDPHALATALVRQLEPCGATDAVVLDVVERWCRDESASREDLERLARLAAAACTAAAPIERAVVGALAELARGLSLTETQAWAEFVRQPTYGHREVLVHLVERHGLAGLVGYARDVGADPRLRDIAADRLARKAADAVALGLPAPTVADMGRAITTVFAGAAGDDIPARFYWCDGLQAWLHADPEGAERLFDEEVRRTGKSSYHLRHALARVPRPKARKAAWCARIRALVQDEVAQHGRLDSYVLSIWLTIAPAECHAWLAALNMNTLPNGVRLEIAGAFTQRPSPESRRVLDRIVSAGGGAALTATTILTWHDEQARKAAAKRLGSEWLETHSAATLREIYVDHLQALAPGTPVNDWMARLGEKGRREPWTFRAVDDPRVSLFLDIDGRGRLRGARLDQ